MKTIYGMNLTVMNSGVMSTTTDLNKKSGRYFDGKNRNLTITGNQNGFHVACLIEKSPNNFQPGTAVTGMTIFNMAVFSCVLGSVFGDTVCEAQLKAASFFALMWCKILRIFVHK